jgi:predicted Rossmann-fold nucleotide-binding protein
VTTTLPPYNPYRRSLYDHRELLSEFDAADPQSFLRTTDFIIYRHFRQCGGAESEDYFLTMMQALHDHAITQNIRGLLNGRLCVAIMGGHKVARNQAEYRRVVMLARALTNAGFIVASGGGPGAMEASHLGASLAAATEAAVDAAIGLLATVAELPQGMLNMLMPNGEPNPEIVHAAHRWYAPAIEIARELGTAGGVSLSIPTWHYGHEPSTPLASHIGKYFQNSIREDGLLTFAAEGIIFTEGKAGTLQEIFQDAAQNYYRSVRGRFSPMVFLGAEYWTRKFPVSQVLRALFCQEDFERYVLVTDSAEESVSFLQRLGVTA